jgi:hypothetical protein
MVVALSQKMGAAQRELPLMLLMARVRLIALTLDNILFDAEKS